MEIQLKNYTVHIGNVERPLIEYLDTHAVSKIIFLVDENTREHCLPKIDRSEIDRFEVIEIPSGEAHKTIDTCNLIWSKLMTLAADRKTLMINLGGGVIGDMGGFCAATFKRGIPFIQIPTTLLSQVDASVGGKLGVDFEQVKNAVGLFQDPEMVIIHPDFLNTLPPRELRSGFAEIIKHALIGDTEQWKELENLGSLENLDMGSWVTRSVAIKKAIVEKDPFENGVRKKLNFGHTIGHAIESYFLKTDTPLLHGEAIAWGMLAASKLSEWYTGLSAEDFQSIFKLIQRLYDPQPLPESSFDELVAVMQNDKKNSYGNINFTMLKSPGVALINKEHPAPTILKAIQSINQLL